MLTGEELVGQTDIWFTGDRNVCLLNNLLGLTSTLREEYNKIYIIMYCVFISVLSAETKNRCVSVTLGQPFHIHRDSESSFTNVARNVLYHLSY